MLSGYVGIYLGSSDSALMENAIADTCPNPPAEGQSSGSHFVQHHAKRKNIRARIERLAESLLGRHVSHSAKSGARAGEIGVDNHGGLGSLALAKVLEERTHLSEAEIKNFHVTR